MSTNTDYLLKNDAYKEEIQKLLKKSKPIQVEKLNITGIDISHAYGEYGFNINNTKKKIS